MSEAELSDRLYRWIGDDGGWQIGREVLGAAQFGAKAHEGTRFLAAAIVRLMRCEHGRLWWVTGKIEEHDRTYREQEKEAERC